MSYIAVNSDGIAAIFRNKPIRRIRKTFGCWEDPTRGGVVLVPSTLPKILNDANLLSENSIPFDKRNMCWGDSPIEILNK